MKPTKGDFPAVGRRYRKPHPVSLARKCWLDQSGPADHYWRLALHHFLMLLEEAVLRAEADGTPSDLRVAEAEDAVIAQYQCGFSKDTPAVLELRAERDEARKLVEELLGRMGHLEGTSMPRARAVRALTKWRVQGRVF